MPDPQFAPVGHFCWPELATRDLEGAKAFYGTVLGWSFRDVPTGMGTYTIFQVEGLDVSGAYQMSPEQGAPPHWNSYVQVESADASCARAQELGAKVLAAPFDVMDVGRMAFFQDPLGAPLALWQSRNHRGAGRFGDPGSLCWTELATRDPLAAQSFYQDLFGWRPDTKTDLGMTYTEFYLDDAPVGGMMAMEGPQWEGVPSHWMPYIAVADCEAAVTAAEVGGGTFLVPPTEIPTVGRFAVLKDPEGAVIACIKLHPRTADEQR